MADEYKLRHVLRAGDIGEIVRLHGITYACECDFDATFEAYVAGPLGEFVRTGSEGGRIWIAERQGQLAGCVAIVPASN